MANKLCENTYYGVVEYDDSATSININGTCQSYWGEFHIRYVNVPELDCDGVTLYPASAAELMQNITRHLSNCESDIKQISIKSILDTVHNKTDETKLLTAIYFGNIRFTAMTIHDNINEALGDDCIDTYYLRQNDILTILSK